MSTILVDVLRGGAHVTQKERPVRRLQDGRYGVVYQGRVYPLQRNRAIELSGAWFPPAVCPVLRELPSSLTPTAQNDSTTRLHVDVSGFYKYVMVDGAEEDLEAALQACEKAGLEVLASGQSSRPSDDGIQHDWYIRVDSVGADSVATSLGLLASAPTRKAPKHSTAAPATQPSLASQVETLTAALSALEAALHESRVAQVDREKQIAVLQRALTQGEVRENSLRQQLLDVKSALSADMHSATASLLQVSSEKGDLETRLHALEVQHSALQLTVSEAEALGQEYATDASVARTQLDALLVAIEDADSRNDTLTLEVNSLRSREVQASRTAQFFRERISCLLEHLLPSIRLERDSLDQILNDAAIDDLRGPLSLLFRLQSSGTLECKRFKSTHWLEAGHGKFKPPFRMYFKKNGAQSCVYLSPKARQEQDEAWLQRN